MRKSTKSAIAITLAIDGAIASPFSSNAAAAIPVSMKRKGMVVIVR